MIYGILTAPSAPALQTAKLLGRLAVIEKFNAFCCVLMSSVPPRSAIRSARHLPKVLLTFDRPSIARLPSRSIAVFMVVKPCLVYWRERFCVVAALIMMETPW